MSEHALNKADAESIIAEAFRMGERSFYQRASACLPMLRCSTRPIDAAAIKAFEDYLADCAKKSTSSSRVERLMRDEMRSDCVFPTGNDYYATRFSRFVRDLLRSLELSDAQNDRAILFMDGYYARAKATLEQGGHDGDS